MLYRKWMWSGECPIQYRMDGKTVIVTGANTGIGKETARELVRRGARVIIACRNLEKGKAAAEDLRKDCDKAAEVVIRQLDLSSFRSVRQFAKTIIQEEEYIHVLINNAGVVCGDERSITEDGNEWTLQVNHLGPFLLTNLLLDKLKASSPSRIVTVSSVVHSWNGRIFWDDINLTKKENYDTHKSYRQSKLANILFTKALAKRIKDTGVSAVSLHPGYVWTDVFQHSFIMTHPILRYFFIIPASLFFMTPREGAQTSIYCAVADEVQNMSGKYFSYMKEELPSDIAQDDEAAERLWDITEKMVHTGKAL